MSNIKLTKQYLNRILLEEKSKLEKNGLIPRVNLSESTKQRIFKKAIKETLEMEKKHPSDVVPTEIDADEYADTLEKNVDFVKALKLEESRLLKRLNTLRELKAQTISKISKQIW
jgi:hypothetical protein